MDSAMSLVDAQSSTIYQGTWQTGTSYAAGEIVQRSGIDYISLHNGNTDTPTPAVESWSGFVEGFFYRGTAPVTATNYNYGHIVLNPTDGAYYIFHSTISASVTRADIRTLSDFAEVVGATGATGHSPRVDSGNAFPTTPLPADGDIFFFDEDVASGLDWLDTDGTTDLTTATAGDMARYDGTDWIKVVNVVGGGGAGTPNRVVLLPGETYTPGAARNFDFDSEILARHILTFQIVGIATSYGSMLSDDLLASDCAK